MIDRKEKIKEKFSAASLSYESISYVQKDNAELLVKKLREFDPEFYPTNILDLGTGTGYIPEILLPYYPTSHYRLNDMAPDMIKMVQDKFKKHKQFDFYIGDMEDIDFPDTDLIISNFALQWVYDLEATLQKFFLRSKILAFSCLLDGTFKEWDIIVKSYGLPSPLKEYPTEKGLMTSLKRLGADRYHFDSKDFQMTFPNARSFMTYLKNLGAHVSNVRIPFGLLKSLITEHEQELVITYKIFFGIMKRS